MSLNFKDFDSNELIKIICELVHIDKQWVPYSNTSSLYIRPTMIGTDVSLPHGPPPHPTHSS